MNRMDGVPKNGVPNDGVPNDGVPNDGVPNDGDPDERFAEVSGHGGEYPGPTTGAPPGAITGSIREDEGRTQGSQRSTTGVGAEATEGLHATEGRSQHDKSSVTNKPVGRDASGGIERAGSEPIDRETEHKGSYGGEGGEPRTSSDQRERSR